MITERIVKAALVAGIEAIKADPSLLDGVFCPTDITTEELDKIKKQWVAKPPSIILNYAKRDGYFPSFTIVTKPERESNMQFIGDQGAEFVRDENGELVDLGENEVRLWDTQLDIGVETEHADVTMWYYEILKRIVLDHKLYFMDKGFYELSISGSELIVLEMENRKPENMFLRIVSMKFTYYDGYYTAKNDRGRKIAGVLIADDNNPESAGLLTSIHTYQEGE